MLTKGFEDRSVIIFTNNFKDKLAKMTVNIEGSTNYKIKGNQPDTQSTKLIEVKPF